MAPPSFSAALFMALICPPTILAAPIVGLRVIEVSSHSVIFFLCSSGIEGTPKFIEKTFMPLLPQSDSSSLFRASLTSSL